MLTLRQCVAQVESSGKTTAVRYEPRWTPKNQSAFIAKNGWMDTLTVNMLLQSSWGKYQVMCDNLYGVMNYQGTLNNFYASETAQDAIFGKFCESIGFGQYADSPLNEVPNLDLFALRYNGSEVYATSLNKVAGI